MIALGLTTRKQARSTGSFLSQGEVVQRFSLPVLCWDHYRGFGYHRYGGLGFAAA